MEASPISPKTRRGPGRPREFDLDQALDAAVLLFRERGYHAASLTDLGAVMKLSNGSIYKVFADKRAIFLAAFNRYVEVRAVALQRVLDKQKSGKDKIVALLRFYASSAHGTEGRRGCLVAGSATDLTTFDAEIATRVTDTLNGLEARIQGLIALGQADGSVPSDVDAPACAHTFMCLLQGLRVAGKAGQTLAKAMAAVDQAIRLLR